ncbi:MAG: Peptide-methionine (S)-S-oxide reductase MsrA, partial [uncultured Solirubrobacteraceae bacterium]
VLLPQQDPAARARPGAAGSLRGRARARPPRGPRQPARAPVPRGLRDDRRRDGLLLGRRTRLLAGARGVDHRGRLRGGRDAEPLLRGGLFGEDGAHRGRARRLRPGRDELRGDAQAVLGGPRPDAGHAPGQRCRHPVPLGDLLEHGRRARGRRGVARDVPGRARRRGPRPDHDGDRQGRPVLLRRALPPAVPPQGPQRLLRPGRDRRLLPDRADHEAGGL